MQPCTHEKELQHFLSFQYLLFALRQSSNVILTLHRIQYPSRCSDILGFLDMQTCSHVDSTRSPSSFLLPSSVPLHAVPAEVRCVFSQHSTYPEVLVLLCGAVRCCAVLCCSILFVDVSRRSEAWSESYISRPEKRIPTVDGGNNKTHALSQTSQAFQYKVLYVHV